MIWHAAVKKGKDLRVSSSDGVNQPCATEINGARQVYSSGQCHFLVTCVCAPVKHHSEAQKQLQKAEY